MARDDMKIILAETAGFCMGVRRALTRTLEAASNPGTERPIVTDGPLIHNRQVLDVLERKGVRTRDGDESGGTVLIRAHGVSPQKKRDLKRDYDTVIDATCPHVTRVQKIAQEYTRKGYHCLIVGDPGHAEVEGVLSYAGKNGTVVQDPEEVEHLPDMEKVVVVAQTTQDESVFEEVVWLLRDKYEKCEVFDTICRATHKRQAEARSLAEKVDAMIVVGGYNSANTRRLADICSGTGTPTYHIETEDELPLSDLLGCDRIGVTAGASTANWMIRRVMGRLRSEHQRATRSLTHWLRRLVAVPVRCNAVVGGGAAALTAANARILGLEGRKVWLAALLAGLFVMSQHLLHQYSKRDTMYLDEPKRGKFLRKHAGWLAGFGVAGVVGSLVVGYLLGWLPFLMVCLGHAVGLLYFLPPERGIGGWLRVQGIQNIPGSKELFVGMAWAVMTVLIPGIAVSSGSSHLALVSVACFAFMLAFHRTLLTDMDDVEGDQLAGQETLAVVLGPERSFHALMALFGAELAVLLAVVVPGLVQGTGLFLSAGVVFGMLNAVMFRRNGLPEAELGEAMIDGQFYLCAVLVYMAGV